MERDERGEYEWEECRECEGAGFLIGPMGVRESCLNGCRGGMVRVYACEDAEPDCTNCMDVGCPACCPPLDTSPLCPPIVTGQEIVNF